jgi:hypothetical protein
MKIGIDDLNPLTPLEIMPYCSGVPPMAGFYLRMIPAEFIVPLRISNGAYFETRD